VFDKLDEEIEQLCREERKIRHQLQDNPEELKLLKEKICPVTKTFSYTVQHTITCTQCGNTSTVNELFRGFSLDIPPPDIKEKPPLQQLLVEFFSVSHLFTVYMHLY
jgi:ubiquitin C-terminal hydrolase